MSSMSDGFFHWLAGFIDGEGSFTISRYTSQRGWRVGLVVEVRADDTAILEEIHRRTCCGQLRACRPRGQFNAKPTIQWDVSSRRGRARLITILDEHPLRAKKARDYAIWRMAHEALSRGEPLDAIAAALRAVRAYDAGTDAAVPESPQLKLIEGGA